MHNFWDNHTVFFLLGMLLIPRITLLIATQYGGYWLIYWFGWLVCPRIMGALIATILYSEQNFWLVFFSWIIAILVESAEKERIVKAL